LFPHPRFSTFFPRLFFFFRRLTRVTLTPSPPSCPHVPSLFVLFTRILPAFFCWDCERSPVGPVNVFFRLLSAALSPSPPFLPFPRSWLCFFFLFCFFPTILFFQGMFYTFFGLPQKVSVVFYLRFFIPLLPCQKPVQVP